jgi:tetratricopeptide (TPR) repeat protein
MSKPMLVTLPLVLLVLDVWPLGILRPGRTALLAGLRDAVLAKAPLFALAGAFAAITLSVQRQGHAIRTLERFPIALRLENAALAAVSYLGDLVWPSGLAAFYPHPEGGVSPWQWFGALAVLAGISTATFAVRRRFPVLAAGWLWYLVMLIPVSGIVQVGGQARADRYTYLPLIGAAVALAWGAARVLGRPPRVVVSAGIAAALLLVLFAALSWRQVGFWRDGDTLFRRVIAVTPPHWMPHYNLGQALAAEGRGRDAEEEYERGLRISPGVPELHMELGLLLARSGRVAAALPHFEAAAAADPTLARARFNYGLALGWSGRRREALAQLREAVRLDRSDADSMLALGVALQLWEDGPEGARLIDAALKMDPGAGERRALISRLLGAPVAP